MLCETSRGWNKYDDNKLEYKVGIDYDYGSREVEAIEPLKWERRVKRSDQ